MRNFIALDGEGIENRYVLLACSSGQYIQNANGIPTLDCFEFLLGLNTPPKSTLVGFFFTYDINMMIRDIPLEKLKKLWKEKWLYWRGYELSWTPSKSFRIKRESPKKSITIYDVGGFFQSSFVKALEKWKAAPPEVIERISSMKEQRDIFTDEILEQMRVYCLEECTYLVSLMEKLANALHAAGLTPNTWQGAGSIAGKLLQVEQVKLYRRPDNSWGDKLHAAIFHSYFGGRVELFLQGYHDGATAYDVNSAYPYAATLLPTLHGKFIRVEHIPEFGLCHVKWSLPTDTILAPFPFRYRKGVYWPITGEGWYHACEVKEAMSVYPDSIKCLESYSFIPENSDKPFSFIPRAFEERAKYKRSGHPAEKALKLGLNALYGKLAQGIGYRGKPPAHRSYLWAGFLTAHCRSTIFRLASANPQDVIMIATDGLFLRNDPDYETGENLGGLSKSEYERLFTAQPGVYSDSNGTVNKTRGFSLKEVDFTTLQDGFSKRGPFFVAHYRSRRFQGLGTSLQRKTMDGWRTWPEIDRKLSLYPARKYIIDYKDISDWEDAPQEFVRHHPPACEGMSEPYTPKTPDAEIPGALEFQESQEQPDPGESYIDGKG